MAGSPFVAVAARNSLDRQTVKTEGGAKAVSAECEERKQASRKNGELTNADVARGVDVVKRVESIQTESSDRPLILPVRMISVCGSNTLTIFSGDFVAPPKMRAFV